MNRRYYGLNDQGIPFGIESIEKHRICLSEVSCLNDQGIPFGIESSQAQELRLISHRCLNDQGIPFGIESTVIFDDATLIVKSK